MHTNISIPIFVSFLSMCEKMNSLSQGIIVRIGYMQEQLACKKNVRKRFYKTKGFLKDTYFQEK